MRIKDISKENRPRERFEKLGAHALSDAELLAVILQTGNKEENVIDMSNRLISKYGIDKLSDLSLKELQEIKGIGPAKAMQIKALFEFNKRHNLAKSNSIFIKSAKDVFELFSERLIDEKQEMFIILMLNEKNKILGQEFISMGSSNATIVHPREIFRPAIKNSASRIILIHNHPTGDPTPSEADRNLTNKLVDTGELLGVSIIDHVIMGAGKWWSWREEK